ncbi:hypothetical protein [Brucella tritici]|uniref:hypothetical protein n=1 Tax=Brucella tritici TaxID=94626 RepID=UPI003D6D86EC
MGAKRMRTSRQQLIEEPATLADRTANGAGADAEPARELALEEAARVADGYDQTDTLTAPKEIAAAIRELAINKGTAGQTTGFRPGLEEAAGYHDKEAEYYSTRNGTFDGVPFKLVAHFHRLHASAIRALSSPDHADAGKVEGDGWMPIESAPKDGTEFQAWIAKYGWEPRCRIISDTEAFEIYGRVDYDQDGWEVYPHMTPTHWLSLPSAPSQEVAGS